MSDWRDIYDEIDEKIRANGIKAVSGKTLNGTLRGMIDAVDENLPKAGKGLNDSAGTFMRDLSIDGKYSSYYNANAGENDYTRVCLLVRGNANYKCDNIIIAVGFGKYTSRRNDLIFINVGGATPTISTLIAQDNFFLERTEDGNFYLCLKKGKDMYSKLDCAFSILMASKNDGTAMSSGWLGLFEFFETEELATGTIFAPVRISEPPLPVKPENPETKFLNGNREWTEAGVILPITTTTLSGNATWNIDDLKNMMRVVLSGSTNTITLPNGGENPFRFQIIVAQDSTGSRALTISGVSGVNVYNPSEFDFSGGGANQICVCTIIWDGTEYIYECTNYVGGE